MSDPSSNVSPDSNALTREDSDDSFNLDNFELLAEQYSDNLARLSPEVRKRVDSLIELQNQRDKLHADFVEKLIQLEARYLKLYEPIYKKRYEIVNGIVDFKGTDEADNATKEKGIPNFWLTAMKNNQTLAELITEDDEGPLKYLKDIKWSRIDDSMSFKLEFFFNPNPYFKNSVLEKTCQVIDKNDRMVMERIGMEIEWHRGKCLTQKVLEKMPSKRSLNDRPLTNRVRRKSFFNFFDTPRVRKMEDHDDDDDSIDSIVIPVEEIKKDYDYGCVIRDHIIRHAVSWFTGEARLIFG